MIRRSSGRHFKTCVSQLRRTSSHRRFYSAVSLRRRCLAASRVQSASALAVSRTRLFTTDKTTAPTASNSTDGSTTNDDSSITKQPYSSRVFVAGEKSITETENYVESMTPKRIVEELDKHIIGQNKAKKAVAVSLRNRWRRQQIDAALKKEVMPMNILMMGPTGTGKTEIARRLAQHVDAPFVKVEATKYTEVGIVGSSAEECVKDLATKAVKMEKDKRIANLEEELNILVEKHILARIPGSSADLDKHREKLRNGEYDNTKIEVASFRSDKPSGFPLLKGGNTTAAIFSQLAGQSHRRGPATEHDKLRDRVPISEARHIIREFELQRHIDEEDIMRTGLKRAEESGIIFLDEIDKLCGDGGMRGDYKGVKGEGVQKELLSIIEGTSIQTDYGPIHTDHILFICAGAFHQSRPSDLLPELQGRLPIRVALEALTEGDFVRILTETEANLIRQQIELFNTEGINLEFSEESIKTIAQYSRKLNDNVDNIGARRLRAVISKVLEDLSFDAPDRKGETIVIEPDFVMKQLSDIVEDEDLSRYIL